MKFRRIGFKLGQRGFTMVELMVALAIATFVTGGIGIAISQVLKGNIKSVNYMSAVREVQYAGTNMSNDGLMAQCISPPSGLPLTLTRKEVAPPYADYRVVYTLLVDNTLEREEFINEVPHSTRTVAHDITVIDSQFTGDKLTLTITATVGNWEQVSKTKTYEVVHRAETEPGG